MEAKSILVSVNGTKTDEAVIRLACDLAKTTKCEIHVTYVIQLKRTVPLNEEVKAEVVLGDEILNAAERCAQNYGHEITTDLLQARGVGPALVNEAIERDVDLIIIGTEYKTHFGEFTVGDIGSYVLRHALCRVILMREPASAKIE